jgi:hypothetical protein
VLKNNGGETEVQRVACIVEADDDLQTLLTRAAASGRSCWAQPEVAANVNVEELGKLGLSEGEEWAIAAFLPRLNDGWVGAGK